VQDIAGVTFRHAKPYWLIGMNVFEEENAAERKGFPSTRCSPDMRVKAR